MDLKLSHSPPPPPAKNKVSQHAQMSDTHTDSFDPWLPYFMICPLPLFLHDRKMIKYTIYISKCNMQHTIKYAVCNTGTGMQLYDKQCF